MLFSLPLSDAVVGLRNATVTFASPTSSPDSHGSAGRDAPSSLAVWLEHASLWLTQNTVSVVLALAQHAQHMAASIQSHTGAVDSDTLHLLLDSSRVGGSAALAAAAAAPRRPMLVTLRIEALAAVLSLMVPCIAAVRLAAFPPLCWSLRRSSLQPQLRTAGAGWPAPSPHTFTWMCTTGGSWRGSPSSSRGT